MEKRKTIGLYSPYVPEHRGGGERYFFSVAEVLSKYHDVQILTRSEQDDSFLRAYEKQFHLDLSRVSVKRTTIGTSAPFFTRLMETKKYDVLYYVTDGSFFFSLAKKNIAHIQFPFTFAITEKIDRIKLACWKTRNANSLFTKYVVEQAWNVPIQYVHYPYVDTTVFVPGKKEKIILSVGRFFSGEKSGLHCKRQDVMVDAFKKWIELGNPEGWKLVLIGSIDPGADNEAYAKKVRDMAKGYPIKILHEVSADVLRQYYATASIYWHAAGFGIDEKKEPKKVEHFGISTIEAMASGAVPVVIGKGGQREIIEQNTDGFLCDTVMDIVRSSQILWKDPKMLERMAKAAREKAMQFNKERFAQTLFDMI